MAPSTPPLAQPTTAPSRSHEALALLLGFAFDILGLHRIEADVDPDNDRCLRLLDRLGFRREGHLRERWHHMGEVRDAIFLGLLRQDWPDSGATRVRA